MRYWPEMLIPSLSAEFWIQANEGGYHRFIYNDSSHNATTGFGHRVHPGPEKIIDWFGPYNNISLTRADQLFSDDISVAANSIYRNIHVPLKQQEFDALTDLIFNRGSSGFVNSVLAYTINLGQYEDAGKEFFLPDLPGDRKRRTVEQMAFTTGIYLCAYSKQSF